MTIAVDFDGTIVEHKYPEIGEEIPFATETLRMLIKDQPRLILWSVREGKLLEGADAQQTVDILSGNTCGPRSTSCADQLAIAVRKAYDENHAA